jgi:hypothetical protein
MVPVDAVLPALDATEAAFSAPPSRISEPETQLVSRVEAQALFDVAIEPKEFWIRSGAKPVGLYEVDRASYRQRVLAFFDRHL